MWLCAGSAIGVITFSGAERETQSSAITAGERRDAAASRLGAGAKRAEAGWTHKRAAQPNHIALPTHRSKHKGRGLSGSWARRRGPPPAPRDSHYSPPAACGAGLIYGSFQARGGNIQRGPEMHEVLKLPDSRMKCNPPGAGGARRRIQRLWCARPLFNWTAPAPLQHKADCAWCITSIMQRQGNKTWLGAAPPTCLSLTREISFSVLTFHLFSTSRIWFLDLFL